ncbi:serine/threonine-protein kinase [Candidatus Protofrankia californiensis]|uniref:serine/threonine-protein kinase n=1 Tax=Candidatus Protofrankia californiensis TaxID=1839754 RepID=UPI0010410AD3|nr:serine/threonine-protein kinase [Candidatus Protofrankia californiensis]
MARSARPPGDSSRHNTPRYVSQRYRLDTPIGRGGAGVVWCGEDELLQRPVAVKEILIPHAGSQVERDGLRARVLREARALARLNSPAIVSVYDVVEEAERHWIVMELVDADSLGEVIRAEGPLPPEQVAAIGLTLTEALAAAHSAGVLHRDVKPGNVLLGRDGHVRLTDFGIAATDGDSTLTGTGALVGSPAYIAPERVRGSSGSPASDLWGLGATLYAAVEGQPPFEGPETYAVLTAVVEGRRRPFRLAGPLRGLLTDLLDRPAEARPDVVEVRRRLLPIAHGVAPVPASVTGSQPKPGVDASENHNPKPGAGVLEYVGNDPASGGDPDAHGSQISPTATGATTADPATVDPSADGATTGGGSVGSGSAGGASRGVADEPTETGTMIANRVATAATGAGELGTERTAPGPGQSAYREGSGHLEEPVTAVAVGTRSERTPLPGASGATTLAGGRLAPPPFDFGGYGTDGQADPDDGLLPVAGGVVGGPPGNSTTHDRLESRRASTTRQGDGPPLQHGVIMAVAASVIVSVAIMLSVLLGSGPNSDSQLQPSGDGSPPASTIAGQSSINSSALASGLKVPPGVDKFSTPRSPSPSVANTSAEPIPTATEAVTPSPSPTQVGASPTTPVTTTSPTPVEPTTPAPTAPVDPPTPTAGT